MDLPNLLQRLAGDGIRLWLDAGRLRYSAPRGASISELMPSLRAHRTALCEMLATDEGRTGAVRTAPASDAAPNIAPLSTMQRCMVDVYPKLQLAHYLHPTITSIFEGALDLEAVHASLRALIARHSALRSRVLVDETGERVSLIEADVECELRHIRIGDAAAGAGARAVGSAIGSAGDPVDPMAHEAARGFLERLVTERFDLDRAPLFRVSVVTIGSAIHVLVLVAHHAIMDGISLSVLVRELATVYFGVLRGEPVRLPPIELPFSDFVLHERKWLSGPEARAAREFWKRRLENLSSPFELPSKSGDRHPPVSHAQLRGEISSEVTEALRRVAREESTTFRCAALAAFVAVLGLRRNSAEACTWVCHAGRASVELFQTIGCFYNLWLLRVNLATDPTFVQLLRQVHEAHLQALPWLELPFTEIGELFGNPSNNIIFSHLLEDSDGPTRLAGPTGGSTVHSAANRALAESLAQSVPTITHLDELSRQSFSLACVERPHGLAWSVLHAPALIDCETMVSMSGHYARILESVAAEPTLRLSRLPRS